VFGRGQDTQAEYAAPDAWATRPPSTGWAVAAAASAAGETSERGLRPLGVKAGDTIFVDGGAGAVAVHMTAARGPIRAIPALYGEDVAAASGPLPAGRSTPCPTLILTRK
jgi:NADPH:quinone reductase-like Zn-dependent oxidoreductase